MKNILLVSHARFPTNSAVHVHHFANELVKLGLDCVVAVPNDENSISTLKGNLYSVTQYNQIDNITDFFANHCPPDLVHAWTPRENVRNYCYALSIRYEFKLVIHLEDNEELLIERFFGISSKNWSTEYESLIPYNFSHPVKYKEFMETADGVTVIIDKLTEFAPASASTMTLYPGVDTKEFYPQPKNVNLLKRLRIQNDSTILCYTGNVHLANADEVRCLYLAVGKRNQEGKPTVLIRTGIDNDLQFLAQDQLWIKKYVIELGWINRKKIPEILALADVLVQPGTSDKFNDYRFPSKIPEFLAMGKPVIIPNTNIGKVLTHEENAIILESVDENSLPSIIDFIVDNPHVSEKLAENALKFAKENLSWANSGKNLYSFYESLFAEEKVITSLRNALARTRLYYQELKINQKNYQINQIRIKELELEINAMKTSKFWKMREQWFKLKSQWFN
ncbi:MAG: glycosyltransferase family 4 protein [Xenococcaceae cyanobacterium MO_167.B27]|nr:glycosyltransferase family 4 protein [Xenococcaceae cyanobacterium MO_167.B27]